MTFDDWDLGSRPALMAPTQFAKMKAALAQIKHLIIGPLDLDVCRSAPTQMVQMIGFHKHHFHGTVNPRVLRKLNKGWVRGLIQVQGVLDFQSKCFTRQYFNLSRGDLLPRILTEEIDGSPGEGLVFPLVWGLGFSPSFSTCHRRFWVWAPCYGFGPSYLLFYWAIRFLVSRCFHTISSCHCKKCL